MKMMEWSVKKDPARPVATIKFDWVDKEKRLGAEAVHSTGAGYARSTSPSR